MQVTNFPKRLILKKAILDAVTYHQNTRKVNNNDKKGTNFYLLCEKEIIKRISSLAKNI